MVLEAKDDELRRAQQVLLCGGGSGVPVRPSKCIQPDAMTMEEKLIYEGAKIRNERMFIVRLSREFTSEQLEAMVTEYNVPGRDKMSKSFVDLHTFLRNNCYIRDGDY